jgi:hypothetical protein
MVREDEAAPGNGADDDDGNEPLAQVLGPRQVLGAACGTGVSLAIVSESR